MGKGKTDFVYDVAVVGGGASGMMAAITAARGGASVLLLEGNDALGRKLGATGNGRCNFTNDVMGAECFYSDSDAGVVARDDDVAESGSENGCRARGSFIARVLEKFGRDETLAFFEELGIYPKMRFGTGYYPSTMQAATVVSALVSLIDALGVTVICGARVTDIEKTDAGQTGKEDIFSISVQNARTEKSSKSSALPQTAKTYYAKKCVLSCGGIASAIRGSGDDGLRFAKAFGHTIIPIAPALVPIVCAEKWFARLHGIRLDATVALYRINTDAAMDGNVSRKIFEERGEVQFLKDGISGIPVFQCSRLIARNIANTSADLAWDQQKTASPNFAIFLDLFPMLTEDELVRKMQKDCERNGWYQTLREVISAFLPDAIAEILLQTIDTTGVASKTNTITFAPNLATTPAVEISEPVFRRIAKEIKEFRVTPIATRDFKEAQVTAGGASLSEVTPETMESALVENLYLTGELLDADGICGGYNLQWAWATGHIAGEAAARPGT